MFCSSDGDISQLLKLGYELLQVGEQTLRGAITFFLLMTAKICNFPCSSIVL